MMDERDIVGMFFDRLEQKIVENSNLERQATRRIDVIDDQAKQIKTLTADLEVCRNELGAVRAKRDHLSGQIDLHQKDLPKLSALYDAANRLMVEAGVVKKAPIQEACEALRKALENAHDACDQIPF